MERKPSDSDEAVKLGCSALLALERTGHPPFFLPLARALIFYESFRIGIGFGMEYGRGFVMSRCDVM